MEIPARLSAGSTPLSPSIRPIFRAASIVWPRQLKAHKTPRARAFDDPRDSAREARIIYFEERAKGEQGTQ